MRPKKIDVKLKLSKTTIACLNDANEMRKVMGGAITVETQEVAWGCFDTPTLNDNCNPTFGCGPFLTDDYTICYCLPEDWCGYFHQTNCNAPLVTVMT
jgi:hypothetical protein